jgi:hypothetical protein
MKLIRFSETSPRRVREELYDLARDPFEQNNLIGPTMSEALRRTHEILRERLKAIETTGWRPHGG